MLRNCLIIFFFICVYPVFGQSSLWKDHFSYRNCQHIAESDNYVATSCDVGLMMYNKINDEIKTYSRVNGLSDINISAIQSLPNDQFIIGYTNGNIDIISIDEVFNIPDIKNKQIQGDKQINHFHIKDNLAYCSTGFALLVINTKKIEIADTYYLGINSVNLPVYESFIIGNAIYAATDRGLLKTQLDNSQIAYYETWEEISGSTDPAIAINFFSNALITVKKVTNGFSLLYGNKENWTELKTLPDFKNIAASGENLLLIQANKIEHYKTNYILSKTIDHYLFDEVNTANMQANDALYSVFEETCYIADGIYGIVKKGISEDLTFIANGPYSNNSTNLHATHSCIYSVTGNKGQDKPAEYAFFTNNTWSYYLSSNTGVESAWVNLISVCSSTIDDTKVFFSSWGVGLFQHKEETPIHIGARDNGLQETSGAINVGCLASDKKGNIWMTNAGVESGIVVKSQDEWYRFDYASTQYLNDYGQMLISKDDYVWMTIHNAGKPQLLVINTQGTLTDDKDDKYRGPIHQSAETNEKRNEGQLKLWDENHEVITNSVLSIAEDKNKYIWLGTDKGVLVYYSPWTILNEPYPIASRIKVPRNDGSNLADYLLEKERVSCITVDGANRKWLGTEGSGLYLVSEDGLKTYHTFNTDNSPLPSNHITSIAISPVTGEVFIATDRGIVSYKGKATEGVQSFSKVYAYPNPVRHDFSGNITISGLMQDSRVKITTSSGRLVHETVSLGGKAYWDGTNFNGEKVKSGVYLAYVSANGGQQSTVTKILIIR